MTSQNDVRAACMGCDKDLPVEMFDGGSIVCTSCTPRAVELEHALEEQAAKRQRRDGGGGGRTETADWQRQNGGGGSSRSSSGTSFHLVVTFYFANLHSFTPAPVASELALVIASILTSFSYRDVLRMHPTQPLRRCWRARY